MSSIVLFVTPVVAGTRWQVIANEVYATKIGNIGHVSIKPGTKNGYAIVTVFAPQRGFNPYLMNLLSTGKFIKIWNQDGTRFRKAYTYKPTYNQSLCKQAAIESATTLLSNLSILERPSSPSTSPPPSMVTLQEENQSSPQHYDREDENEDAVSTLSGHSYIEDVDAPQEEAGVLLDYSNASFLDKPPARRKRVKVLTK
uniref:Uncharacterized protein n=1 Tax=viral metagenome TaxID=1070528 RepID=A0A6C0AU12_9ZZZZ